MQERVPHSRPSARAKEGRRDMTRQIMRVEPGPRDWRGAFAHATGVARKARRSTSGPRSSPGAGGSRRWVARRVRAASRCSNPPGGGETVSGWAARRLDADGARRRSPNPARGRPTEQQIGIAAPDPLPITGSRSTARSRCPGVTEERARRRTDARPADRPARSRRTSTSAPSSCEIPQAQADILNAGLRANPIFYADGQLVPYGQYTRNRPGGQTQYDVNISYPFDLSHKRQARTLVATRAKRVLEAQYQDAVRLAIDDLYTRLRRRPGRPADGRSTPGRASRRSTGPLGDADASTRRTRRPGPTSTA